MFCTFTALRSRKLLPNNHITCIQQSAKFHSSRAWKIVHRSTHYSTLGIPTTSTAKDIKAAYYESSKRWHPDRNKGSNEAHQKFLKISEAYSVLGNERKRRDYD
ncbi:DnaJ domain-containing protein, partial [Coemansia spiralis]